MNKVTFLPTAEPRTRDFKADANALATALARGHERRKGHVIEAHYVETAPGSDVWELVRTCCEQHHHVTIQVGH